MHNSQILYNFLIKHFLIQIKLTKYIVFLIKHFLIQIKLTSVYSNKTTNEQALL